MKQNFKKVIQSLTVAILPYRYTTLN